MPSEKTKRILTIITAIAVPMGFVALGAGLFMHFKEQIRLLKSYCYKIRNVVFKNVTQDKIDMSLQLAIRNQSDIDIDISKYQLDIFIDSVKIATITDSIKQKMKSKAVSNIALNVSMNPKQVFKNTNDLIAIVNKFLFDKNNLTIGIKGTLSAGSSFLSFANLPIDMTMTFAEISKDDPTAYKCKI